MNPRLPFVVFVPVQMPFFWLSTYEGKGDPKYWSRQQEADFHESGARFVRVGDMASGLGRFTRKIVEQPEDPDPHFCMPGELEQLRVVLFCFLLRRGGCFVSL